MDNTRSVRENRRDNQEWTIQRNCLHWVHKTQDEDKQSRKSTSQKIKKMSNTNPLNNREWTQVLEKGKQILLLIKHPSCILGNLFNRVSRTPHVKDLFCRLHKTVTATKDYFWSLPFSPCFTSGSQSYCLNCPILSLFLYSFNILLNLLPSWI